MLQIKLSNISALMLGSGTGQGSYIDGDIILDDNGLPVFPGRRLKGLLRESAMEVLEMLHQAGFGDSFAEDILEIVFGSGDIPAGIRVDNLYLVDNKSEEYRNVIEWIAYLKAKHRGFITKEAIINALTSIRQQTAVSEEGCAKQGSLRTVRVLQANQEFFGAIEILNEDRYQEIVALLALACSNLRRVGSGRNRGWGEVKCCLYDDRGEDQNKRVLEKLNDLQKGERIRLEADYTSYDNKTVEAKEYSGGHRTMAKLSYRITSLTPLLFTSPDGDENMVNTLDYIPGSALHGFYANRFIQEKKLKSKMAHQDPEFKSWFLDGCLRFSNGYPRKHFSGRDGLFYPTPLFLHTDKNREHPYNLLAKLHEEDSWDETKVIGGYCTVEDDTLYIYNPKKVINFHLVRNKHIQDAQARIEGHVHEGGIFHYEAIRAGQEFFGFIYGPEAELKQFVQLFGNSTYLKIGRSMNTQYGKAQIEFGDITPATGTGVSFLSIENANDSAVDFDSNLLLYLSSPLLLYNKYGVNSVDEQDLLLHLQSLLGVPKIKVIHSFTRIEQRLGFASHLKIFEPSFRYWAAGSSFLLELTDENGNLLDVDEELRARIRQIMVEGVGEKRQMGFGRVVFARYVQEPIRLCFELSDTEIQKPKAPMPQIVQEITQKVYQDHRKRLLATAAIKRAKDYYQNANLSSHLLGRLERICQSSTDATDFSNKVNNLRKKALDAIKEVRTNNFSLYNDLTKIELDKWCHSNKKTGLTELLDYLPQQNDKDEYKLFWQVFFRTIRRLRKQEEQKKLAKGRVERHA